MPWYRRLSPHSPHWVSVRVRMLSCRIDMMTEAFPLTIGGELVRCERTLLTKVEDTNLMQSSRSVRFLVLHCSATRRDQNYSVEQLTHDHRKRGFRTVGYHFYIRKDGTVTQHRKLLEVGAHARPFNRCSIGICYEGGLDEQGKPCDTRTPAQTERLIELLYKLHKLFPKAKIVGHRDLPGSTPKDCPCLDAPALFGWIAERDWASL